MIVGVEAATVAGPGRGLGPRPPGSETDNLTLRDDDGASETAERLRQGRTEAAAHELDVRDAGAFEAAVEATVDEYGLDILLNNAGVSHDRVDVEDVGTAERDRVLDVDVKGLWNGCEAAIPHLGAQGDGAIVDTASLAGVIGSPGALVVDGGFSCS